MALCKPAYTFLVISTIALLIMFFQNVGNANMYCLGTYSCGVYSTSLIFLVKLFYILFWTWLLNIICDEASPLWSWFLVIFPFFLMFGSIALMLFNTLSIRYENLTFYDFYTPNRSWNEYVLSSADYFNPFSYVPQYFKP
jgi:hypothetical protein